MKKTVLWIAMLCLLNTVCSCSQQHDHKGKTPLVKVADNYLYQEDLQMALPLNLSVEDSLLFAETYIRNWVEDVLLFEKAKDNVRDSERIKALVESYRRALLVHSYQEELVRQQLAEDISSEEIADYYEKNKSLFVLEKPIVKGLFIKVPLHSSGLSDVRRWYKKNEQDAIEKLEKYSLRNAVMYDFFYDRWLPLEEIEAVLPVKPWSTDRDYLKKNPDVELKDTAFHYFLHVEEFLNKEEQKPLDFAEEEIKENLINLKRVDYLNRIKEGLYQQATGKNEIVYYYLNKDE